MLFSSFLFILVFLPVTLIGFFLCGQLGGSRFAAIWLVTVSLVFYGWWNPALVPLLCSSIVGNHLAVRLVERTAKIPRLQSSILLAAVVANIGALVYFKYLASLLAFLEAHGAHGVAIVPPVLPLGISFFTFTQIGLLIDTRVGSAAHSTFLDHALFVTFFPHLIAGPVLHHREMMPQFMDPATYRASAENIAVGMTIFAIGLAKKTLCADSLSGTASAAFGDASQLGALPAWQGAIAYSFQLYFDFSGYSDMAIGLARMFGVRFPANFNSPYKARNVIEYWQRWHMTLTRYLTRYLYTPLALRIARHRAARCLPVGRTMGVGGFLASIACPTLFTMTLAGIWHGAGLTFVVFGLLHGFYLVVNHAWRMFRAPAQQAGSSRFADAACLVTTFLCVLVGAVVFRSPTLAVARDMLAGMAGLHGAGSFGARSTGAVLREWLLIFALAPIVFGAPNTQDIMRDYVPAFGATPARPGARIWQPRLGWAVACGVLAATAVMAVGGSAEFLYFAF